MIRIVVALVLCLVTAAPAAILTVRPDGSGDQPTIQAALNAASSGDIIELADGVYTGTDNRNLDPAGKTLTVRSSSGDPATCIIDCQGVPGTTRRGFRFHSGEDRDFLVSGLTITHGSAAPNGAGVSCTSSASPTFEHCVIENGIATQNGGAVYCSSGADPLFRDCILRDNIAGYYGGGLRAISASAQFIRCHIEGNQGNGGGGLSYYWCGPAAITDCTFVQNHGARGGGIFLFASEATVTGCDFTDNIGLAEGGGIDSVESQLTVSDCRFLGNHAGEFGGAISSGDDLGDPTGWLRVDHCLMAGNTSLRGGAVHGQHAEVTLTSCTLVGNRGDLLASGVSNFWSWFTLDRVIIAGGEVTEAVYCEDPSYVPVIICSDIAGNAGGDWTGCIADQLGAAGNIAADPEFCDPNAGDYTLHAASPCATAVCGFMGSEPVACDDPLAAPGLTLTGGRLLPVYPNPTSGGATVAWSLPRSGTLEVQVITVRGERLWHARLDAASGPGTVHWDGRDTVGRRLSTGVYLVQLSVDGILIGSDTVVLTR